MLERGPIDVVLSIQDIGKKTWRCLMVFSKRTQKEQKQILNNSIKVILFFYAWKSEIIWGFYSV